MQISFSNTAVYYQHKTNKPKKQHKKIKLNDSSCSYYARGFLFFWFVVFTKTQTLPPRWAQQKKSLHFTVNLNELAKKQSIMQTSLSNTAVYYQEVHLYY
jgi:hypothetical protein